MNININKFWKKRSINITDYDPTYKVVYLGNVLTAWAKGDGCVDKPLATLWKNYCQTVKPDVGMKLTVCNSGLKAVTKEHGLTEYWANRITYCVAHPSYPKIFCWVYRHEGKKLKQELRCHAVLCGKEEKARQMALQLQQKLSQALQEFRREKLCRQNARLSLANCVYDNPSLPRRKILLSTGSVNYRPPLERSKSAPKLGAIEETPREEETEDECYSSNGSSSSSSFGSGRNQKMFGRSLSGPPGPLPTSQVVTNRNTGLSRGAPSVSETALNRRDSLENVEEHSLRTWVLSDNEESDDDDSIGHRSAPLPRRGLGPKDALNKTNSLCYRNKSMWTPAHFPPYYGDVESGDPENLPNRSVPELVDLKQLNRNNSELHNGNETSSPKDCGVSQSSYKKIVHHSRNENLTPPSSPENGVPRKWCCIQNNKFPPPEAEQFRENKTQMKLRCQDTASSPNQTQRINGRSIGSRSPSHKLVANFGLWQRDGSDAESNNSAATSDSDTEAEDADTDTVEESPTGRTLAPRPRLTSIDEIYLEEDDEDFVDSCKTRNIKKNERKKPSEETAGSLSDESGYSEDQEKELCVKM